jgi:hypothetical protein
LTNAIWLRKVIPSDVTQTQMQTPTLGPNGHLPCEAAIRRNSILHLQPDNDLCHFGMQQPSPRDGFILPTLHASTAHQGWPHNHVSEACKHNHPRVSISDSAGAPTDTFRATEARRCTSGIAQHRGCRRRQRLIRLPTPCMRVVLPVCAISYFYPSTPYRSAPNTTRPPHAEGILCILAHVSDRRRLCAFC